MFEPAVLASAEQIGVLVGWSGIVLLLVGLIALDAADRRRRAQLTPAQRQAEDRDFDELDTKW
jgi:hypothetical protein